MGSESSKQNQKNVKIPNSKDKNQERKIPNFDSTKIKKSKLKKKSSSVKQVKLRTIKEKSTHKNEKNKNLKSRKFSKKNQNLSFYKKNSQKLKPDQRSKSPEIQTAEETICLSDKDTISKNLNENVQCEASVQNSLSSDQEGPKIIENLNCEEISPKIIEQSSIKPVVTVDTKLKSRLYSDHTTHAEVSPRTAMYLAASLENDLSKGNKGAKMFQILKQKSQEWIIDETNVKKSHHLPNAPEQQLINKLSSEFNHFSKLEEVKKNQNYKIIVENLTYEMNKIGNKNRQQMVKNNFKDKSFFNFQFYFK